MFTIQAASFQYLLVFSWRHGETSYGWIPIPISEKTFTSPYFQDFAVELANGFFLKAWATTADWERVNSYRFEFSVRDDRWREVGKGDVQCYSDSKIAEYFETSERKFEKMRIEKGVERKRANDK